MATYKVRRNKLKCSSCKNEWIFDKLPINLDRKQWRIIAKHFVLGLLSNRVPEQLGVSVNTTARAMSRIIGALAEGKLMSSKAS